MPMLSYFNDFVGVAQHRLWNQNFKPYYLLAEKFFGKFFTLPKFSFLMCTV